MSAATSTTPAVCAKCGEAKPVSDFYKSSKTKTGLQAWCRECQNGYQAGRRNGKVKAKHTRHNGGDVLAKDVYGKVRKVAVRPRSKITARFAVQASTLQPVVQILGGTTSLTLDLEAARRLRRDLDSILAGL